MGNINFLSWYIWNHRDQITITIEIRIGEKKPQKMPQKRKSDLLVMKGCYDYRLNDAAFQQAYI